MRITTLVAGLLPLALLPSLAFADASVAGYWKSVDLGDGVTIEMNITANGQWDSKTLKGGDTIAQMAGRYQQTVKSDHEGILVFTPTKSHITSKHGAPKVEHDSYQVGDNGESLALASVSHHALSGQSVHGQPHPTHPCHRLY